MPGLLSARAHAKINLALAVAPPEPSGAQRVGWHRIATWMAPIALHDDVSIQLLDDGAAPRIDTRWADDAPLRAGQPVNWAPERDLAWWAREATSAEVGRPLPCHISIRKRIPAGAGLGGGSADAAAVLQLLDKAFALGLGAERLRAISARLGSDIAYFIDGDGYEAPRGALVTGFGDVLRRCDAPDATLVLILPHLACSTPEVYRAFDRFEPGPLLAREVADLVAAGSEAAADGGARLFNDLAAAAESVQPRLAALRSAIGAEAHLPVHVTGSGSAMFVLCRPDHAEALALRLRPLVAPGTAVVTRILSNVTGAA